jgi:endonuclease-3
MSSLPRQRPATETGFRRPDPVRLPSLTARPRAVASPDRVDAESLVSICGERKHSGSSWFSCSPVRPAAVGFVSANDGPKGSTQPFRKAQASTASATLPDPMTRADKAARIARILKQLYPTPRIPLTHRDPYTLLVSVVLSAQCTDARVNQVVPELFALADTPERMLGLGIARIRSSIRSCGLAPSKAKAIHGLSKLLLTRHGGCVPSTFEELEQLPGVGHKTASVVLCQAFGKPAFPVDTHIHRLAARWGLSRGRDVEQTERDLKRVFPEDSWGRVHLQIIYFGREHCPARGHDLRSCPICSWAATKKRIAQESAGRARDRGPAWLPSRAEQGDGPA